MCTYTQTQQRMELLRGWVTCQHVLFFDARACAERFFSAMEAMLAERHLARGGGDSARARLSCSHLSRRYTHLENVGPALHFATRNGEEAPRFDVGSTARQLFTVDKKKILSRHVVFHRPIGALLTSLETFSLFCGRTGHRKKGQNSLRKTNMWI